MVPLLTSSMTSWGRWPSTLQPRDWEVPRISLPAHSSLAKDWCHICPAMWTISWKGRFPLDLIFSVSWWFIEDSDNQGRDRRYQFNLGWTFWRISFIVISRTSCQLPWWYPHQKNFWDRSRGSDLGGKGSHSSGFTTGAHQVSGFYFTEVTLTWHGGSGC